MSTLNLLLSSHDSESKTVVIVKGNPKYLNDPKVSHMAKDFYQSIKERLEDLGFKVSFDAGLPKTSPDVNAYAWVAHSRGIERLQYAPKTVKTVALETEADWKYDLSTQKSRDDCGIDPKHYQLSNKDIRAINALKN